MNQIRFRTFISIGLLFLAAVVCDSSWVIAQEIPGELVFEETFEDESPVEERGWYMVARNDVQYEFLENVEEGPDGGTALVIYTLTYGTTILNDLQFSNEAFAKPEGSELYDWRVTFWIRTNSVPFTIRPIIAMSVDPWDGVSVDLPIETAGEWTFVDITLPASDFLTTDPLLLIFHMGNPAGDNLENEVWFDDIRVYLLNQTSVSDWSLI